MNETLLLTANLACALGLSFLVYRYDMYEREPWYMLLIAALLGAGAWWILSYAEDSVLNLLAADGRTLVAQAAVAGILEELSKLLVVLAIWLTFRTHFNDPFDGLIYGALAGIGFGVGESAFYLGLLGSELPWFAVAGQEVVRLILHLLMGALTCVGLGLARFRVARWPYMLLAGVTAAMFLHFCWDYFCGLPSDDLAAAAQQRAIAVGLMLVAFVLFGVSVIYAAKRSADAHPLKKLTDLWGWPFTR